MIPEIIPGRGPRATRRLTGCLYGKGTVAEHVDPQLVAPSDDFTPAPTPAPTPAAARTASEGPILTDIQWADIGRRDHDIRAVQREARKIEIDYGLR